MKKRRFLTLSLLSIVSMGSLLSLASCNFFEDLGYLMTKKDNPTEDSGGQEKPSDSQSSVTPAEAGIYTASLAFDDDHPIADCGYDIIQQMSLTAAETTLKIENNKYSLKKVLKSRDQDDTTAINPDLEYSKYLMYFEFNYTGECTESGNTITLNTPTSGNKIAYYTQDVSERYPEKFPITSNIILPNDRDWSKINTQPVNLVDRDYQYAYFGNLYIQKSSEFKTQIVTVDGSKITSMVSDENATALSLKTRDETEAEVKGSSSTDQPDQPDTDTEKPLLTVKSNGQCTLFFYKSKFTFDYNGMVQEDGTYTYEDGVLTLNAIDGATIEQTLTDDTYTIKYTAKSGAGRLYDTFTITKAQLDDALLEKELFKLQRDGAGCILTIFRDGSFEFNYNDMVKETGTYTYKKGVLSLTVKEGAKVEITEADGVISIKYTASQGGGRLFDTFTVTKAQLDEKLGRKFKIDKNSAHLTFFDSGRFVYEFTQVGQTEEGTYSYASDILTLTGPTNSASVITNKDDGTIEVKYSPAFAAGKMTTTFSFVKADFDSFINQ